MGLKMIFGIITGRIKVATVASLLSAMKNSGKVVKLYTDYPETPDGFDLWAEKADNIWEQCGSMAENLLAAEKKAQ